MNLILPDKDESITIKIIDNIKKIRDNFYCNCKIWCDPRRKYPIFRLKIDDIWNTIFDQYKTLEELVGEEYILDEDLIRLVGEIITIKCIKLYDMEIFYGIEIREDLKELDRKGEWEDIIKAKKDEYWNGKECIDRNMIRVDEEYAHNLQIEEIRMMMRKQKMGIIRLDSIKNSVGWG